MSSFQCRRLDLRKVISLLLTISGRSRQERGIISKQESKPIYLSLTSPFQYLNCVHPSRLRSDKKCAFVTTIMASKLRRTPLFGYDGNLGIPIIPAPEKRNEARPPDYGYKVGNEVMLTVSTTIEIVI